MTCSCCTHLVPLESQKLALIYVVLYFALKFLTPMFIKLQGVVHHVTGYMLWASATHNYTFDYHPNDVYFCTADIGWITGHTYITYGPLLNRATSVMVRFFLLENLNAFSIFKFCFKLKAYSTFFFYSL